MTTAELADHWDAEASNLRKDADATRSLSRHEQLHARADQLRQCAMQLRLATGGDDEHR